MRERAKLVTKRSYDVYHPFFSFHRKASTLNHPGAMYRLGVAELNGELGINKNPRDGVKWLKRAAEASTVEYPHALHELALLHERGIENVVFVDLEYAVTLYAQAADLGYAPSAFRLGECYEYGKLNCPQDAALSIHYYTIAAQQGHREACFALTAWYLVGSPNVLPQSDEQAYLWARRAAEKELPKAEYAIGYFTEVGIGIPKNTEEAMEWYKKAARHGDKRAIQRLQGKAPENPKDKKKRGSQADDCILM
jgi:TPR repeat protein